MKFLAFFCLLFSVAIHAAPKKSLVKKSPASPALAQAKREANLACDAKRHWKTFNPKDCAAKSRAYDDLVASASANSVGNSAAKGVKK